jgi:hypothetical protein
MSLISSYPVPGDGVAKESIAFPECRIDTDAKLPIFAV